METNFGKDMNRLFFITGAESTGKSDLTIGLAQHYSVPGIPEYARAFLESINRPYTFEDVVAIAHGQAGLIRKYRNEPIVFFDTCLINLKVWFREVYQVIPGWLEQEIREIGKGTYLLCEPDLPWVYDPLRENPHRREYLTLEYEKEMKSAGFDYFRISGMGDQRLERAVKVVNDTLKLGNQDQETKIKK